MLKPNVAGVVSVVPVVTCEVVDVTAVIVDAVCVVSVSSSKAGLLISIIVFPLLSRSLALIP